MGNFNSLQMYKIFMLKHGEKWEHNKTRAESFALYSI